jgi:UDP-N-acetylmuramate dehydrogenase
MNIFMQLQEHIPVGSKTTMRIGSTARYYADLLVREDAEEAVAFAQKNNLPLIVLGGGSNTVFADEEIQALVVRLKAETVERSGNTVTVQCGKILASLINELGEQGLDLSALTGIPGTVGGALFGNAGQGPKGIWFNTFVRSVSAYIDDQWRTFTPAECEFSYRESIFKKAASAEHGSHSPAILWETTLELPPGNPAAIHNEVERLLKKRFETQPHLKTAGSCFKATPEGQPAWQLIDAAGLRGTRVGDIEIAQKHANFLLNVGKATYADAKATVDLVRSKVPQHLEVEMRFIEPTGRSAY